MTKEINKLPPWRYASDTPLIRHEFMLSSEHQAMLDSLVANHPEINTRVGLIRLLLDGAPIEQVKTKTVKMNDAHVRQIARVGSLLNQYAKLAYVCAQNGEPIAAEVLRSRIEEAQEMLSRILVEVTNAA
jgi:hypothetical protein